jgi:hypothetical protein
MLKEYRKFWTDERQNKAKAQGLNPADMNMFQQEQLSQALGGMDLNTLQKIATNDGTNVGGLSEGNVKKGNQNFLSKTQSV